MATKYKENPLFKDVVNTAQKLGQYKQSLSPKAVNVDKYKNLGSPQPSPTSQSNLGTVTVPYGGSTKYEQFHPGVDTANKIGTPIPASLGGIVQEVVGGKKQGDKGYGNYVTVKDSYGGLHRYSHLNNSYVKVGQNITPGAIVGGMGNTGSTYSLHGGTGSHLDYRIKDLYGKYVNPSQYLASHKQ